MQLFVDDNLHHFFKVTFKEVVEDEERKAEQGKPCCYTEECKMLNY